MESKQKILVSIIEDNKVLRTTLASCVEASIECDLLGAYANFEDAYAVLENPIPDVVLMDINLPGINGIEGTQQITNNYPQINIIIVTALENGDTVFKALSAGATGYLTKTFSYEELIQAIVDCANGGAPMSAKIAKMVVSSFKKNTESPLTTREKEVLDALALGYSYNTIAKELFLSVATVKFHIKNIYLKLQVKSKSEALTEARKRKYI